jgi:hypothetical protein
MTGPSRFAALLLGAGAILAGGCGGSGDDAFSDKGPDGVRAVTRAMLNHFKDSKFDEACGLMTEAAQAETGGSAGGASNCAKRLGLARALIPASFFEEAVKAVDDMKVTIEGGTATAAALTVASGNDPKPSHYVYRDGGWLIAGKTGK